MLDECILCHHKLSKHIVQTYDDKKDTVMEFFIRCDNDKNVEGYKHCDCNLGFESVRYVLKPEKVNKER